MDVLSISAPLPLDAKGTASLANAGLPRKGHDAQRKASPLLQLPHPPAGGAEGGALEGAAEPEATASSCSLRLKGRGMRSRLQCRAGT